MNSYFLLSWKKLPALQNFSLVTFDLWSYKQGVLSRCPDTDVPLRD